MTFLKRLKILVKFQRELCYVTADVIRLYPGISHRAGLKELRKRLSERDSPKIPTKDIVRMAEFVLKIYFKFTLNLLKFSMARLSDKNLDQLLAQNLPLLLLATPWMKQRQSFLKVKN